MLSSPARRFAGMLLMSLLLHLILMPLGKAPWAPSINSHHETRLRIKLASGPDTRSAAADHLATETPAPAQPIVDAPDQHVSAPLPVPDLTSSTFKKNPAAVPKPDAHTAPIQSKTGDLSVSHLLEQVGQLAQAAPQVRVQSAALQYGTSARGPLWTQYVTDWVNKIERVGTLNFPADVRREGLSGGPKLSVSINADGSLRELRILKSSGNPILDQAACRLVTISAPFAPFPPALAKQTSTLEIQRKWNFTSSVNQARVIGFSSS